MTTQGPSFPCPRCGSQSRARTSTEETHLLRTLYYQCQNLHCGHTWVAHLSFVRTLSPSAFGPVEPEGRMRKPPPDQRPDRGIDPLTLPFAETRAPAG